MWLTRHSDDDMRAVWRKQSESPPPAYRYPVGPDSHARLQRPDCIPYHNGMGPTDHMRMPPVLPAAAPRETPPRGSSASSAGCGSASNDNPWHNETAGLQNEGADLPCTHEDWQRLLEDLRGIEQPARKRRHSSHDEGSSGGMVEVQPTDGVFLTQGCRETCTPLWVVNSSDWIDVEHVLRKMLRCESSECHAFYSMGYVFFRSCAVSHVTTPSDFLQNGTLYRFPGTEVVVAVARVHEEGVLEVECYLEYTP